jgi:hypothetical protein
MGKRKPRPAGGAAAFEPQNCCRPFVQNWKTPKSCIKVHQTLNTKVVDLKPIYNFHKGYMGFFSLDFAQQVCQL